MTKEFINYLFDYWKNNFDSLCEYCKNNVECSTRCPKYQSYGKSFTYVIDGFKDFDDERYGTLSCMDDEFGTCPMLKDTVCNGCVENNNVGFAWNGEIPNNYDSL